MSAAARAVIALSLVFALGGCGGGGSGSGDATASLSIRAHWEQPPAPNARATLTTGKKSSAARNASFGVAIPAAVNNVRITLVPASGSDVPSCCLAIARGTQAFADRRVVIGALPPGDVLVQIAGYPGSFAPSDGVAGECVTFPPGAGAACDDRRALPSFASNNVPVAILPGEEASTGDVAIASLPFLLALDPAEGVLLNTARVPVSFAVVSANSAVVAGSVDVSLQAGEPSQTFDAPVRSTRACDERGTGGQRCSNGPDLDVFGLLVDALSAPVPAGPARINIQAQDSAGRRVAFVYDVTVQPGATTTTTPTSTTTLPPTTTLPTTTSVPTSSTTQTTIATTTTTTTTTLPPQFTCTLTYGVTSNELLTGIEYVTDYTAAPGRFERASEGPGCVAVRAGTFLVQNQNDEVARTLRHQVSSSTGFANPGPIVTCNFLTDDTAALTVGAFAVSLVGAVDGQGNPVSPTVAITKISCGGSTTTTTGSTSTTTAANTSTTSTTSTTTPSVSSTSTTITTTTTATTTTTTLAAQFACGLTYGVTSGETLERLVFATDYAGAQGRFERPNEGPRCQSTRSETVLQSVVDDTFQRLLTTDITSAVGFPNPGDVLMCKFLTPDPSLSAANFAVTLMDARLPGGSPANPALQMTGFNCATLGTTTTTTLPTSFDNCDITFGFTSPDVLGSFQYEAAYIETGGKLQGFGVGVQCVALAGDSQAFEDKESSGRVGVVGRSVSGIAGPADLTRCRYIGPAAPGFQNVIGMGTLVARDTKGIPTNANIQVTKVVCGL